VKTFGRFSSHRRFEYQKNISGRIFQPGDRQTVSAHDPLFACRAVASGEGWSVLISGLLLPPVRLGLKRTPRFVISSRWLSSTASKPEDLPRAPNLMRETRRI
jgi:hypothetical protein